MAKTNFSQEWNIGLTLKTKKKIKNNEIARIITM